MSQIEEAKETGKLHLNNFRLGFVPAEIRKLSDLVSFDISMNNLTELPEWLGELNKLTHLAVADNKLEELPKSMEQLSSLTHLYLYANKLTTLSEYLGRLSALKYLQVRGNQLKVLPESLGQLSALEQLYLGKNQLTKLPDQLGQLSVLVLLDVGDNKLTELPEVIVNLPKLNKFYTNDNPWQTPPQEVFRGGETTNLAALRNWFLQVREQGIDHLYEAKLLILGEGGAGKTTLAKKLKNPKAKLPKKKDSTEGIDLSSWSFSYSGAKNGLKVNIWDFGGQDIYKFPHQIFLTQESLYTIVADTRSDDTDFNYWLQTVELYGGEHSPVLVVGNEINGRPLRRDLSEYQAHFDIKEILSADLSNVNAAQDIREEIQKWFSHLPHIGSEVPARWVDVRHALLEIAKETPYISQEKFFDICAEHEISKQESALNLSHTLHHRIGVILHYKDDPVLRNTVFLQPDWATRAVYQLIEHEYVTEDGRFMENDIYSIWDDTEYKGKELDLLALLEKFELCYRIPETQQFIVPTWLSTDKPKEYQWTTNKDLKIQYHYPAFIPLGLLLRLMVNVHDLIERDEQEMAWRRGMVLRYRKKTRAEIIQTLDNHRIAIKVQGTEAAKLRAIIVEKLEGLHKRFEKLNVQREIPCNCEACVKNKTPYFYAEPELESLLEQGVTQRQCGQSGKLIEIKSLLEGVVSHGMKPMLRMVKPSVFISYAWGGESEKMADQVDEALQAAGLNVTRDKRDVGYKGRIQDFMRQLGRGSAVVVILSDKYLHSENCMFELTEIAKNGKFYDRIFPIIMPDANFYKVTERMKLVKHWQDQLAEINATAKELDMDNIEEFMPEYKMYKEIQENFGTLTTFLKDLNTLTPQIHIDEGFETLIEEIKKVLG